MKNWRWKLINFSCSIQLLSWTSFSNGEYRNKSNIYHRNQEFQHSALLNTSQTGKQHWKLTDLVHKQKFQSGLRLNYNAENYCISTRKMYFLQTSTRLTHYEYQAKYYCQAVFRFIQGRELQFLARAHKRNNEHWFGNQDKSTPMRFLVFRHLLTSWTPRLISNKSVGRNKKACDIRYILFKQTNTNLFGTSMKLQSTLFLQTAPDRFCAALYTRQSGWLTNFVTCEVRGNALFRTRIVHILSCIVNTTVQQAECKN